MRIPTALACAALSFLSLTASAETPSSQPAIAIHRASSPITVDGELSEPAWKDAVRLDGWVEGQPGNNIPAKVRTVAWLTYDDRYFYVGIEADDPDASKIRAPYVERDEVIGTDDNIAIFLDTRGDKRSSLELRVNPRGIQGDGIYDDAGPTEDFSPDYFYDTAARIHANGWTAEFRIPFSSLRYSSRNPTYNILVWRNYPRDFRYAFYSAPVPRGSNCLVCHAQTIVGLENLPESGHVTAAPYLASQRVEQPVAGLGSALDDRKLETNVGADVKWTPSGTTAVDMTINPDFSQIEADVPQITVNERFAVFFPEKRPFFLEGFDLFNTPLQVLYTRTITSPRAGIRSTGRIGSNAYTVLVTDDRGGGLTILPGPQGSDFAPQDFRSYDLIGRVRHEMGSSFIGGVVTDREISGGGHNRVVGPDFLWRPNDSDSLTAQFLYSDTENPNRPELSPAWNGESLRSHALRVAWDHIQSKYNYGAMVQDLGDGFRADLGFIPQAGFRELFTYGGLRFYREKSSVRTISPNAHFDRQEDLSGRVISQQSGVGVSITGTKNLFAVINFRPAEKVLVGNDLFSQNYAAFALQFDPSRRFTRISINGRSGQSIDFANRRVGRGNNLGVTATFRPIDRTTFDLESNHEVLNAGGGRVFSAQVERLRTLYSFSANSLLRLIVQYSSVNRDPSRYTFEVPQHSGNFLGSLLYSYKLNWQTVLFVGYGDTRVLTAQNDLVRADRSLFFKVSYALQK